jgi:hypothetical protein
VFAEQARGERAAPTPPPKHPAADEQPHQPVLLVTAFLTFLFVFPSFHPLAAQVR